VHDGENNHDEDNINNNVNHKEDLGSKWLLTLIILLELYSKWQSNFSKL
jgi:hypothetical protein